MPRVHPDSLGTPQCGRGNSVALAQDHVWKLDGFTRRCGDAAAILARLTKQVEAIRPGLPDRLLRKELVASREPMNEYTVTRTRTGIDPADVGEYLAKLLGHLIANRGGGRGGDERILRRDTVATRDECPTGHRGVDRGRSRRSGRSSFRRSGRRQAGRGRRQPEHQRG